MLHGVVHGDGSVDLAVGEGDGPLTPLHGKQKRGNELTGRRSDGGDHKGHKERRDARGPATCPHRRGSHFPNNKFLSVFIVSDIEWHCGLVLWLNLRGAHLEKPVTEFTMGSAKIETMRVPVRMKRKAWTRRW